MAGEAAGIYDREVAIHNLMFFVLAGHETTLNMISNGVLAFIRNPAQWDRLRSDPSTWAAPATEEILRYDGPTKSVERVAMTDVEFGGKLIHAGDRIWCFVASANRDPEQFAAPDVFDIARSPNSHIGFGHGIHLCIGMTIARLEGQEVFAELAHRYERFHLITDPLTYVPTAQLRVLKELRVSW
jgi:cytochrome P450